jgi:hypothetical protein
VVSGVLPPKLCPACGSEFRHEMTRCSDCGGELVLAGSAAGPAAAPSVLGEGARLQPLRVAPVAWARELSRRLSEAGIPHRIDQQDREPEQRARRGAWDWQTVVLVRAEDLERAREIDAEQLRDEIPDLPEDAGAVPEDPGHCPACDAECPPEAAECPSCGLVVPGVEAGCPRCGGRVDPDHPACPACGWTP